MVPQCLHWLRGPILVSEGRCFGVLEALYSALTYQNHMQAKVVVLLRYLAAPLIRKALVLL